jgi:hypothetical protein
MVKEIATECKCEALSTKLIPPKTKKKKKKEKEKQWICHRFFDLL